MTEGAPEGPRKRNRVIGAVAGVRADLADTRAEVVEAKGAAKIRRVEAEQSARDALAQAAVTQASNDERVGAAQTRAAMEQVSQADQLDAIRTDAHGRAHGRARQRLGEERQTAVEAGAQGSRIAAQTHMAQVEAGELDRDARLRALQVEAQTAQIEAARRALHRRGAPDVLAAPPSRWDKLREIMPGGKPDDEKDARDINAAARLGRLADHRRAVMSGPTAEDKVLEGATDMIVESHHERSAGSEPPIPEVPADYDDDR